MSAIWPCLYCTTTTSHLRLQNTTIRPKTSFILFFKFYTPCGGLQEAIEGAMADGYKKIAVVYGGLHCRDLETRFKSLGLRRSETSWVWAWTTKPTIQLLKLKSSLPDLPTIKLPMPSQVGTNLVTQHTRVSRCLPCLCFGFTLRRAPLIRPKFHQCDP